ncbi:MAG: DUF4157 domain-containing protein [Pleurocapsa sp. SU_196_0]|nr:DUF4157 domain-containing protein [Pleurocapsa sp. SU_196_0]
MGDKARGQIQGAPNVLRNYAGFKNAGATLVNHFRKPGSSHTMQDLAGAIGRFTDVGQRGAVESAAFAALGNHPSFPAQLQRALDDQDAKLEVQRETWQRDLEPVAQRQALEEASGEGATSRIEAARGNGQPLPEGVRKLLEAKWNTDLSRVRVHVDGEADLLSQKLNAKAFTTGNNVFFRSGTWNPTSLEGLQLIAHETWHTVQQAQGLVQKGIDRDQGLETEARSKGGALLSQDVTFASSRTASPVASSRATPTSTSPAPVTTPAVQRQTAPTTATPTSAHRPLVAPTNGPDVAYDTLVARLVALAPEAQRPHAASSIPPVVATMPLEQHPRPQPSRLHPGDRAARGALRATQVQPQRSPRGRPQPPAHPSHPRDSSRGRETRPVGARGAVPHQPRHRTTQRRR